MPLMTTELNLQRMDDAAIIEAVASECETLAVDENEDPDASDS